MPEGIKVKRLIDRNKEKKWALITELLIPGNKRIIQEKKHKQDLTWRPSNKGESCCSELWTLGTTFLSQGAQAERTQLQTNEKAQKEMFLVFL